MFVPYRKTKSFRTTLVQEARTFLAADTEAPAGSFRVVQVMIPASPQVSIAIDGDPDKVGLNREYKVPVWSPNAQVKFTLLPEQSLMGMSGEGLAKVSVIVEYLK